MHRPWLILSLGLSAGVGAGSLPQACPQVGAVQVLKTFDYTGDVQTLTLPTRMVSQVYIQARGAQGGSSAAFPANSPSPGGLGGYAEGYLLSTVDELTLTVVVGGAGGTPAGGYNGGGSGAFQDNAGGGGGASDVRVGGNALSQRVLVAGGGGGGGRSGCPFNFLAGGAGGAGGGGVGANGPDAPTSGGVAGGGQGGNVGGVQGAPGRAGLGCVGLDGQSGVSGTLGQGGLGGAGSPHAGCTVPPAFSIPGGGGGGGGWIGGGGGGGGSLGTVKCRGEEKGAGGGGGGGQSHYDPAQIQGFVSTPGSWTGHGVVILSYCIADQLFADSLEGTAP